MKKILLILELLARCLIPPFYSFSMIERVCKEKLTKDPEDISVRWILSNLYILNKDYNNAKHHLEEIIELGKNSRSVRLLLSNAHFMLGNYSDVVRILKYPGTLQNNDKENYYIGASLMELERYNESIEYLVNYTENYPKDYIVFVRLGYAFFKGNLFKQALDAYQKAEKLNPLSKEIKDNIEICKEMIEKSNVLL
jgi:tetratricopeptide (TPR) repeat protein